MTTLPQPPNPWPEAQWLAMTQPTIWRVGDGWRCILEAGDDAWPDGKLGAPYCDEQATVAYLAMVPAPTMFDVALAYPELRVVKSHDVTNGTRDVTGGGFGVTFPGALPGRVETPGVVIPEPHPAPPEVVPLPATAALLICALAALWRMTR